MIARDATIAYAANLPGIESLADQMHANLKGKEHLPTDGRLIPIIPVPIGATETAESINAGVRAITSNRLSHAILAFSINHVGEYPGNARLQENAKVVEQATLDVPIASTFFTENYTPENGTMGNIRARLLGATGLTMLESDYPLSRYTPVITGDIDMLKAGSTLLPQLSGVVDGGRPFAQAPVVQGNSQDLHRAKLLSPEVSFPNMDKVLYFYDTAIGASEYAQHGIWNAMLLGDYFDIGGYDITKLYGEDMDLQNRLLQHRGKSLIRKLPLAADAFAVVQPRRYYARMQSGRTILDSHETDLDFSTVNDICRGKPYEGFQDISVEEAEAAIAGLWAVTGETGPKRTLGDAAVWWRFWRTTGSKLGFGRNPPQDWKPREEVREAYQDAQRAVRRQFADLRLTYANRLERMSDA